MQYPEVTSATVEQAWPEPGSLKSRSGHHLEPQGFKGLFVSGTAGHFFFPPPAPCSSSHLCNRHDLHL